MQSSSGHFELQDQASAPTLPINTPEGWPTQPQAVQENTQSVQIIQAIPQAVQMPPSVIRIYSNGSYTRVTPWLSLLLGFMFFELLIYNVVVSLVALIIPVVFIVGVLLNKRLALYLGFVPIGLALVLGGVFLFFILMGAESFSEYLVTVGALLIPRAIFCGVVLGVLIYLQTREQNHLKYHLLAVDASPTVQSNSQHSGPVIIMPPARTNYSLAELLLCFALGGAVRAGNTLLVLVTILVLKMATVQTIASFLFPAAAVLFIFFGLRLRKLPYILGALVINLVLLLASVWLCIYLSILSTYRQGDKGFYVFYTVINVVGCLLATGMNAWVLFRAHREQAQTATITAAVV